MSDTYNEHYSNDGFWNKIKKYAKKAGATVLQPALELFYAIESSKTPVWAKAIAISALGYFILPIDLVPDAIPVLGFGDDVGIMLHSITTIGHHITTDITNKARNKANEWMGM